ncbi:MAG: matrixin family metalloprotease [Myxococcales bacterium]
MCNTVDQQLAGERRVRLYSNGNVALAPATQGLANYYRRHALSFLTDVRPETVAMGYALDTDNASLSRVLAAAFPGVNLNDDAALMADPALYMQVLTVAANFVFKPMIDFASVHSSAGASLTNLVVLPTLQRSGGAPIAPAGASLAGLSISPTLQAELAGDMSDDARIWQGVNFPPNFTPMVMLGNDVLQAARSVDPILGDLVVAHEFGHSAGLVHSMVARNLMYPAVAPHVDDCTNSLNDAQLMTMRTTLGIGPAVSTTALVADGNAARRGPTPSRSGPSFAPARLRALLAGDGAAMNAFIATLLPHAKIQ